MAIAKNIIGNVRDARERPLHLSLSLICMITSAMSPSDNQQMFQNHLSSISIM